ncbi:MAG: efflux RND transporter permease subunit [Armatimonadetes bacterium]|nr:efflux RND transporter permease subunit [Armatimonadota bacterium]
MGLTRLSVERPLVLCMAVAALILLGLRARAQLPAEMDPRVDFPVVHVVTVYPGAGPEEVEEQVTRPLEEAVAGVNGVTSVSSSSQENISFVSVDFQLGTDLNAATADLRARIEGLRSDLPPNVEAPTITKLDINAQPILVLGVTGARPLQDLRAIVDDDIKPQLARVPGVAAAQVVGGRRREVRVAIDPAKLQLYGLSILDVLEPLRAASQSAPAGSIVQGQRDLSVRVQGEFQSLNDIRAAPIPLPQPSRPDLLPLSRSPAAPSTPLRLGDLATVSDTVENQEQITRVARRESIGIVITRLSDANTVSTAAGIKRQIERLHATLPPDVRLAVLQDNSQRVEDALEDIYFALIFGSLLAVLVVFTFLHSVKDTVIVALAIPTSIITTFLVMWAGRFTLNQMTMLALSLSVGILVDDSILVLDCIHRHRHRGKEPHQAALDGRAEIGLADATNTLVDVVVFVPIAFMGGMVGQFFRQFGLTVATATLMSMYVSFSLTPMLAAHWFRPGEGLGSPQTRFARWFDRQYGALDHAYRGVLRWALGRRPLVVGGGFGSLAIAVLLAWRVVGFDFVPPVDHGQVAVTLQMPPEASLAATDRMMRQIEDVAVQVPEVAEERMFASLGEIIGGFGSLPERGPQFAQLTLTLRDKDSLLDRVLHPFGGSGKRQRSDEEVAADLRRRLAQMGAAGRIIVSPVRAFTGSLAPLQLGLYGTDLNELERATGRVLDVFASVPGLRNPDSSLRRGKPEVQLRVERERAADQFVTPAEVAGALRVALEGDTSVRYREGGHSYAVRVQLARAGRSRPEALQDLVVARRGDHPVFVGDVTTLGFGTGPTKILRRDRVRRVVITAELAPGVSLGAAQEAVERRLRQVDLGNVRRVWEGEYDDMIESTGHMISVLLLSIALSYILMAALFNSLVHPLTIVLSVPMALVGAILGLIFTGTTLNIVSMIGIIMLVGLVAKNAILLVDYTNTLRAGGLAREAALQEAAPVRLRPILMTTLSTLFGMLPIALRIGRAAEMRAPMAIAVIGGLALSTLLTLVVIPVVYTYFDDLSRWLKKLWGRQG